MTYAFERDESRAEVRQNVAGTLRFYPKVDGSGNVLASSTGGDNTITVYDSRGTVLAATASISPTTEGSISRFDIPIAAISTLQENAYVVLTWKPNGSSTEYVETIYFDVVLQPWGPAWASLNDILARVPSLGPRLDAQRTRLASDGSISRDQLASQYAVLAHQELYRRLRSRIAIDTAESGGVKVRPRLIANRVLLHPVEAALAISYVYRADLTGEAEAGVRDEAARLHDVWTKEADAALSRIGNLEYDINEDRIVEDELVDVGRARKTRRVQG